MFVVSVVSDIKFKSISQSEASRPDIEFKSRSQSEACRPMDGVHQRFSLLENNKQDHHFMGTVIFRGYPFPIIPHLGTEEMSLIMEAYSKSFKRHRTNNQGSFFMTGKRQSCMSSSSMGVVGDKTRHDYYNESSTNTSLVPLTSSLINSLQIVTEQSQDASGQILIGVIKKALSKHYKNDDKFVSGVICPYDSYIASKN